MYQLTKFSEHLLKFVWKISLTLLILLLLYASFTMVMSSKEEPISVKLKVTDKFEQDKGFVLFNKDIKTGSKEKKIRVEFLEDNKLSSNVFTVSQFEYDQIEKNKIYIAKFKGNKFGYVSPVKEVSTEKPVKK